MTVTSNLCKKQAARLLVDYRLQVPITVATEQRTCLTCREEQSLALVGPLAALRGKRAASALR